MHALLSAAAIAAAALFAAVAQTSPTQSAPDPATGKALFEGRGGCTACHFPGSRARKVGPDLSWIGMLRTPDSLRRSLADPAPQGNPRFSTAMPSYASTFSSAEIDHLVAYLGTLRAIPPSVPRERRREIPAASENVAFFDRPERNAEEQSDALVHALEIHEGTTIADLGAGTGYFTWRLAQAVGAAGRVIAADIQPRMLELAADTVKQHGFRNVEYVLGTVHDPKLPPAALDLVFIAHAYHEFSEPEKIMEAVRRSLKPDGRLVIVEYAKENRLAPAASLHKMSFDEIRDEIEQMGFDLQQILDFLPVQHGLIFTVR